MPSTAVPGQPAEGASIPSCAINFAPIANIVPRALHGEVTIYDEAVQT